MQREGKAIEGGDVRRAVGMIAELTGRSPAGIRERIVENLRSLTES